MADKILFGGQEYDSLEAMPPEVRQQYEQVQGALGNLPAPTSPTGASTSITFNGQTYATLDEMPPDIRQSYQALTGIFVDANKNGVPDILEGGGANINLANLGIAGAAGKIVYNGKTYANLDGLPPEARARVQAALGKLDANKNGIPDILEDGAGAINVQNVKLTTKVGKIIYQGQAYDNVLDLPPEARARYEAALSKLGGDKNSNGIPDMFEERNQAGTVKQVAASGRLNLALMGLVAALLIVIVLLVVVLVLR